MALHLFCIECGTKIPYSLKKPKFCPECGYNFVTGQISKETVSSQSTEEDTSVVIPKKLEFSIDIDKNSYKFEELAKEEKLGTSRGEGNSKTGDELLKEIRSDCAPTKGTIIE